jgi:hemolysin activation/secretion protein
VTPRSLRPEAQPAPPPAIEFAPGAAAKAPPGAENLHVTPARIVVDGEFADMAGEARRIFQPLEGHTVTVAELYGAAAKLEQAYNKAGYFLARVAVPRQSLADGGAFHVVLVDGFIEAVQTDAVPSHLKSPVTAIMAKLVGRRRLKLAELQARLQAAQALPGAQLRSTIAQGQTPGGALLILDGGYKPVAVALSGDNNLGPAFKDWGVNIQLTLNSPTGHGEQAYAFISGSPHADQAFKTDALRRIAGGGIVFPVGGDGWAINPEVTWSDTNPLTDIFFLQSHDRLWRESLNLLVPVDLGAPGSTTGRVTLEHVDELSTLPVFGAVVSHDRLAVLRGHLGWDGAALGGGLHLDGGLSKGLSLFGAGDRGQAEPFSRGSDPLFTKLEATLGLSEPLPGAAAANLTVRAQTSFGTILPTSETFDLGGTDGLSSFTPGALATDAGTTARLQIERPFTLQAGRLTLATSPYVFGAAGWSWPATGGALAPRRATDYGAGVRFNLAGVPFGARPRITLEYGHGRADRGPPADDRILASLGLDF